MTIDEAKAWLRAYLRDPQGRMTTPQTIRRDNEALRTLLAHIDEVEEAVAWYCVEADKPGEPMSGCGCKEPPIAAFRVIAGEMSLANTKPPGWCVRREPYHNNDGDTYGHPTAVAALLAAYRASKEAK